MAVHKGLGLKDALKNGVMRDLDAIDEGFPVLAGSIGPSRGFMDVVEIGTPVSVMGLNIVEGEHVHANGHGAVVIPEVVLPDLQSAIETVIANENIILGPARRPGFNIQKLEEAWVEFERRRT